MAIAKAKALTMEPTAVVHDLQRRVALLEDREEIRDLIERYAEAADRRNAPDMMRPLFGEHAIWEAPGFGRFEGRAAILDGLSEIAATRLLWTMHYMISPRIRIAEDRLTAHASWRVWELATVSRNSHRTPDAVWGGGTYQVDLSRVAGRWQFAHVRLNLELISRYSEGWAAARIATL
jgi:SnoaL-like domain